MMIIAYMQYSDSSTSNVYVRLYVAIHQQHLSSEILIRLRMNLMML